MCICTQRENVTVRAPLGWMHRTLTECFSPCPSASMERVFTVDWDGALSDPAIKLGQKGLGDYPKCKQSNPFQWHDNTQILNLAGLPSVEAK